MGTHCLGLHLPAEDRKHVVSAIPQNDERLNINSPLIQTEYLFSLDHAPSLALADGTTWWLLVTRVILGWVC
jgi:hypothetical protein